ncbi:uncharacterized protein LOC119732725 [Patiria miniata]|uniref:Uncharacterized protein n=1 Tax=Patiria miniata TaxID=46514 RepID=A0A914AFM1_PATMI|nr:uncharacterized protein LOC119732725 [Patiria miniata]
MCIIMARSHQLQIHMFPASCQCALQQHHSVCQYLNVVQKSSTTNPHVSCQLPVCFLTASLCMPVFEHGSGKDADSLADEMKQCQPIYYHSVSNIQPYVIQDEITL